MADGSFSSWIKHYLWPKKKKKKKKKQKKKKKKKKKQKKTNIDLNFFILIHNIYMYPK